MRNIQKDPIGWLLDELFEHGEITDVDIYHSPGAANSGFEIGVDTIEGKTYDAYVPAIGPKTVRATLEDVRIRLDLEKEINFIKEGSLYNA